MGPTTHVQGGGDGLRSERGLLVLETAPHRASNSRHREERVKRGHPKEFLGVLELRLRATGRYGGGALVALLRMNLLPCAFCPLDFCHDFGLLISQCFLVESSILHHVTLMFPWP